MPTRQGHYRAITARARGTNYAVQKRASRRSPRVGGGLLAITFSDDGKFLALGCGDGIARLYETSSGKKLAELTHQGWVNGVAFSPDNQYLATGSADRTAHVYEIATGLEVSRMHQPYPIHGLAFVPGGGALITAAKVNREMGYDINIQSDLLRPEDLIASACERLTRNFTPKEWSYYIGDEPYRKTCPNVP